MFGEVKVPCPIPCMDRLRLSSELGGEAVAMANVTQIKVRVASPLVGTGRRDRPRPQGVCNPLVTEQAQGLAVYA